MVAEEIPLEVLTQVMGNHVGAEAKEMATLAQKLKEEGRREGLRDACIAVLRANTGLGRGEAQRLVPASWDVSRLQAMIGALAAAPDRDAALALLETRAG